MWQESLLPRAIRGATRWANQPSLNVAIYHLQQGTQTKPPHITPSSQPLHFFRPHAQWPGGWTWSWGRSGSRCCKIGWPPSGTAGTGEWSRSRTWTRECRIIWAKQQHKREGTVLSREWMDRESNEERNRKSLGQWHTCNGVKQTLVRQQTNHYLTGETTDKPLSYNSTSATNAWTPH